MTKVFSCHSCFDFWPAPTFESINESYRLTIDVIRVLMMKWSQEWSCRDWWDFRLLRLISVPLSRSDRASKRRQQRRFISSHLRNHLFMINFLSACNRVWLLLLFPGLTLVICVSILQTACGKLDLRSGALLDGNVSRIVLSNLTSHLSPLFDEFHWVYYTHRPFH